MDLRIRGPQVSGMGGESCSAPIDGSAPPIPMFSDDVVLHAEKRGCFQIVVLFYSFEQLPIAKDGIRSVSCQIESSAILDAVETTYLVRSQIDSVPQASPHLKLLQDRATCVRILDADEYTAAGLTEAAIATNFNRPAPLYYDANRTR